MSGSEREPVTSWGERVKRVYGPADVPPDAGNETPGEYPFTRGIHPSGYRSRRWTMRQYAGFGSAAETNKRYRFLLEQGQTGLSVAFDLPTQMGYDPDASIARGEVGKVGVSIACLEDMQDLFEGIPLDRVSTSMTINATAAILLALYVAVARRQAGLSKRILFLQRTQQVFNLWHVVHRPFSYAFAILAIVHIGLVLYMGYRL